MSFSLFGLLGLQAYWIKQTLAEKEAELNSGIQKALAMLEEDMNEKEAMVFIQGGANNFKLDSLPKKHGNIEYVADFRLEEKEDSVQKNIQRTYKFSAQNGFEGGIVIMDDHVSEVDVINLRDSMKSQVKLIQRFNQKKFALEEAIDKIAFEFAFKETSFQERIKSISFDSLLSNSLEKEGLGSLEYSYSLKSLKNDSIVLSTLDSDESKLDGSLFFQKEILNDANNRDGGLLELKLNNGISFLIASISSILSIAILLSLLLLFTFFYTLQKIIQQKKLSEMKSDLINNMTHEFKTPIATISLAIDSMFHPTNIGKAEELKKLGGIIKKENERMHLQVERLLDAALFENGKAEFKIEKVAVHPILEEIINIYTIDQERKVEINTDLIAGNDTIKADPLHLFNVFRNIVDNAIKFSKDKTIIHIRSYNKSGQLIIEVQDEGIGMSGSTLKHIFDNFYRYTEGNLHNTKGFGLGLAYAKKVMDHFEADIVVKSELAKGSIFKLSFKSANEN